MSYIDFVKKYAKKNNISFKEAMKKAAPEYQKKVGKGEVYGTNVEEQVEQLGKDVDEKQQKREKSARKIQKVAKKYNKKKIKKKISKNIVKKRVLNLRAKRTPNKSRTSSGRGAVINEAAGRQRPYNRRRSEAGRVLRSKGCGYGEGKKNSKCMNAGSVLAKG